MGRGPAAAGETDRTSNATDNVAVLRRSVSLLLLLMAGCARERARPNVLLITLDTTRADRLGCYGGPAGITPALDALAAEGIRFAQADSPVPLTLPAHATLLSGLLPLHHGLRVNGAGGFPRDRETLATLFSGAGYRTAAFVGSFVLDRRFGLGRGFASYDDEVERDPAREGSAEPERRAEAVIDAVERWLDREDSRPFFVWVHLFDPHAPYEPPEPYGDRFGAYGGEIAYIDAQLGRLLARVDRGNTIVALAGDHGESLGEHGELMHGLLLYESTLRVPLIVAAPSVRPYVVDRPVSTADLAPTLAGLAGLELRSDGRDLSSDLRDGRQPDPADLYAETEYPRTFGWSALASLRRENLKLVAGLTEELVDARSGEKNNIADRERRTFHDLSSRLRAIRATAVASPTTAVDDETRAKLASLGYVAPVTGGEAPNADPRSMTPIFADWERANAALLENRIAEVIAIGEKLIAADPANRVFRSTLARGLRMRGDSMRAIQLYREAVALSPANPDAWYDLAAVLQEAGRVEEASAVIAEALRLDPNRAEAYNVRGIVRAESGDAMSAIDDFRRAIAIDPRNARAHGNLGNALRSTGRIDEAVDAYRRSIAIAPRHADALNGLGAVLVQQGRASEALAHFDAALAAAPDLYEARLNRAVALEILGDRQRARDEVERLLRELPESGQFAGLRANAARFRATLRR
jgi:arylsulfatase A-like enzyme/Flp pilus assembly protein TadD